MRKHNFFAGPSVLPVEVLEELRDEIVDYRGVGLSLIESSHRSPEYDEVHSQAVQSLTELLGIPDTHSVLLIGGGATLQFSMVPMNLMIGFTACDITVSGSWAKKAKDDAALFGTVNVVFDGSPMKFTQLPAADSVSSSPGSAYLHITSNETIEGVQWKSFPKPTAPLVADMSSDIMSRAIDVSQFGLIYAGAQKNLGPAGVTIVIVRDELLERSKGRLGAYLSYETHAKSNSLYNTPPVFSIYAMGKVLAWLKRNGGLAAVEQRNAAKAGLLYDAIENSGGFYRCPVHRDVRSTMNVVFTLQKTELEKQFIAEAEKHGMLGLAGHRSIGGVRASLYNALPMESVKALVGFMQDFAKQKK